jgi:hypothetical protein
MNSDLAYLLGVFQSDGCYWKFYNKKRNKLVHRLGFYGNEKSLPMLEKAQAVLKKEFGRNLAISMRNDKKNFYIQTSINSDLEVFERLGFLSPKSHTPRWISKNEEIFFAYLAGMIDGDGNVCIKRPSYPQCRVTITSEFTLPELKVFIEKFLSCKVNYYKYKNRNAYNIDFYISSKNARKARENLYPNLTIKHKRDALNSFLGCYFP